MRRFALIVLLPMLLAACTGRDRPAQPGVYHIPLPARCELWLFTESSYLGEQALALACPGVDLLRLWPLPMVQPWADEPDMPAEPAPLPSPGWQVALWTP